MDRHMQRRSTKRGDVGGPVVDRGTAYLDLPETPGLMTVSSFLQALKDGAIYVKKIPAQKRVMDAERFDALRDEIGS